MADWTTADIPDQTGRTAVVTGANTGVGYEIATALAAKGATVVLAVRNLDKGEDAARQIRQAHPGASVELQKLDLSSLESVRAAAEELNSRDAGIDLLINNAGVMSTQRKTTPDGFELQFGTNHLGHFALTGLLLDRILAAPGSRIVTMSSIGHKSIREIRFDDLQAERSFTRIGTYSHSKLANLMFSYELQRRLAGTQTISVAAHPGASKSSLGRSDSLLDTLVAKVFSVTQQSTPMGALPALRAATDPGVIGGQYFGPRGIAQFQGHPTVVSSSPTSHDAAAQRRLWEVSEKLTGVVYPEVASRNA